MLASTKWWTINIRIHICYLTTLDLFLYNHSLGCWISVYLLGTMAPPKNKSTARSSKKGKGAKNSRIAAEYDSDSTSGDEAPPPHECWGEEYDTQMVMSEDEWVTLWWDENDNMGRT